MAASVKEDSAGLTRQKALFKGDSEQHEGRPYAGIGVRGSGHKRFGEQGGMINGPGSAKGGINRGLKSHPQH